MSAPDTVAACLEHGDDCTYGCDAVLPTPEPESVMKCFTDEQLADRERAAAEKAWDEGYERRADAVASFLIRKTSAQVARHLTPPNPYRRTDKEADRG